MRPFPLSIAISLIFGSMYPVPGSLYPISKTWRYRDLFPKIGKAALAGTLPTLVLLWGVWGLQRLVALPPAIETWLPLAKQVGGALTLFDIAMPFFPFVSYNGRRIWDWSKIVWLIMATATVAALFLV